MSNIINNRPLLIKFNSMVPKKRLEKLLKMIQEGQLRDNQLYKRITDVCDLKDVGKSEEITSKLAKNLTSGGNFEPFDRLNDA